MQVSHELLQLPGADQCLPMRLAFLLMLPGLQTSGFFPRIPLPAAPH